MSSVVSLVENTLLGNVTCIVINLLLHGFILHKILGTGWEDSNVISPGMDANRVVPGRLICPIWMFSC